MGHVGPPISLGFDITQNHVLYWDRQTWHFPWDVGLETAPCFAEMLKNGTGLVGTDALGHHVEDVVHYRGAQFEIVVAFHSLFGDSLSNALGVASFELTGKKIAQPTFKKGHNASQEEEPHTPAWSPEATTGTFAYRSGVEAIIDEVLEVLAHTNLAHQSILVAIHACELANMSKDVLEAICKLEGIDVAQSELDVGIDNELGEAEDLATQMEGVTETRLLALLGGESLDGFEVEVVIEVQIVEILAVDEKIEHVVALAADLEASLDPIESGGLEEFRRLEGGKKIALVEGLGTAMLEAIEDVALEELLIAHSNLDGMPLWAVLLIPRLYQRDILCSPCPARFGVERPRGPVEGDSCCCVVSPQIRVV
jgi:hypothetical protein